MKLSPQYSPKGKSYIKSILQTTNEEANRSIRVK